MIVAIDGPAGSGKTTVAKLLAKKLDICYLDTGATYRVLTCVALENNIDLLDGKVLGELANGLDLKISGEKIYLNEVDYSQDIRTPQIDKNISVVVAHKQVRKAMVDKQRQLAKEGDFVVEGRDITTVVFSKAKYKFYLDADGTMRSLRRFNELKAKGLNVSLKEIEKDLFKRDYADKNREVGPLLISKDAVRIDTTNLSIEQSVEVLGNYIASHK